MNEGAYADWLQQFIHLLPDGASYLLLMFLIAFGESLPMIGLLMPGSTLVVLAGFLVVQGKGTLLPLIVVTAVGSLCGDLLSFWLGAHLGGRLLRTHSFIKHRKLILQAEDFFSAHGGKSIFFARFLGPIRGITPFIAGFSRMNGNLFCRFAVISAVLWGLSYPVLGFLGGTSWQQAQSFSARFGLLILLGLAVTIVHYWLRHYLQLSSRKDDDGNCSDGD